MTDFEEWRPVPGFEGSYEVSSFGRVQSLNRLITTKAGVVKLVKGKVLTAGMTTNGYPMVHLGRSKAYLIHLLVASAFLGARPPGMYVCHHDGDKTSNHIKNLRYGSPAENQADRKRHGTDLIGEALPQARLTAKQVLEIKQALQSTHHEVLARRYGITRSAIYAIAKGRNWKHIQPTRSTP